MTTQAATRSLSTVIGNLRKRLTPAPAAPPHGANDPLVTLLVYSFMLWESGPRSAGKALQAIHRDLIDVNELRVALPEETAAMCSGKDDGLAVERAARLRAALNDLYAREHAVSLDRVASLSKREAREFLDSLEGMPAFVAARVTLHGFGAHAVPVDDALASRLRSAGAIEEGVAPEELERWLERKIRASDSAEVSLLFDAWRDAPIKSATEAAGRKKAAAKKTTKKKASSARARTAKKSSSKRAKKGK